MVYGDNLSERMNNVMLLLVSTFTAAVGQLLFKLGLNNTTSPALFVSGILIGLGAYAASTVFYFVVLSRVHLSWAYGIGGLSYIFATLFAAFILLENIPPLRWVGVAVIFVGVILIGLS